MDRRKGKMEREWILMKGKRDKQEGKGGRSSYSGKININKGQFFNTSDYIGEKLFNKTTFTGKHKKKNNMDDLEAELKKFEIQEAPQEEVPVKPKVITKIYILYFLFISPSAVYHNRW